MQRFKAVERTQAIERGVDFIYRVACNQKNFRAYGAYLACFFPLLASTAKSISLQRKASEIGHKVALRWQDKSPTLSARASPESVCRFVIASSATDHFGLFNTALKEQIRQAAKRFSAEKILGFDPTAEPPPDNLPERCRCGSENRRARKTCKKCKRRLTMCGRYNLWSAALSATYWGERCGVTLGANYADVIKWLPNMRPYPGRNEVTDQEFSDTVYAVTHVIYTLNGYGRYNLSRRWLPSEFRFLIANIKEAIDLEDPDMVGEFLDTLRSFGLSDSHPTIRLGLNYLLSHQNDDGSWGDLCEADIFNRFHATWTAIDGLREYAWRGQRLSYPELLPLLRQWVKTY